MPRAHAVPAAAAAPQAQSRWGEPLPAFLVQLVFAERLPADARARCCVVCRAWAHALLRGPDAWRCWTRLDLSPYSGVTCTVDDVALEAAAALACGRLQELDVRDCDVDVEIVCGILIENKQHLRRLALGYGAPADDGEDDSYDPIQGFTMLALLAEAGPALQSLEAEAVICKGDDADLLPLLRAATPAGPLRIGVLFVDFSTAPPPEHGAVAEARQLGEAVAAAELRMLRLGGLQWVEPPALDALADVLLARTCRVKELELASCGGMSPAFLPVIARLLAGGGGGALEAVRVWNSRLLFKGAAEEEVEAVRAALMRSTLKCVHLNDVGLMWPERNALRLAADAAQRLRVVDIEVDFEHLHGAEEYYLDDLDGIYDSDDERYGHPSLEEEYYYMNAADGDPCFEDSIYY